MPQTNPNHSLYDLPLRDQAEQLSAQIRRTPGDARLRIYLAQLSMALGLWERAVSQMQAAAQLDAAAIPMAQAYREAIRCELIRERVFAGGLAAPTLGAPLPWQELLAQALTARTQKQHTLAEELQAEAYESATATPFNVDGKSVEWLADADSRLGPTCEVFLNGQYYWLPFEQIQMLEIEAPQDLRDLIWSAARLTLENGTQHMVMIPSRYPLSYTRDNDHLALSALTEWEALSDDSWAGFGQRTLVCEKEELALLTIRKVESLRQTQPDRA